MSLLSILGLTTPLRVFTERWCRLENRLPRCLFLINNYPPQELRGHLRLIWAKLTAQLLAGSPPAIQLDETYFAEIYTKKLPIDPIDHHTENNFLSFIVPETRMAEVGSHSSRAKMAIRIFVKQVFTIFAINASFLLVNANLQI